MERNMICFLAARSGTCSLPTQSIPIPDLIGGSPSFIAALEHLSAIAQTASAVLITGETGTGKELCARGVHLLSARRGKMFFPINCADIVATLAENEFFGHAAGSYTGANRREEGLIQAAEGGTLFLDELDSMPLSVQPKFLRFLDSGEFRHIGSRQTGRANVRIVAATNADLEELIRKGRFRADLYYRLQSFKVHLPPLRLRLSDIPLLAEHFLAVHSARTGQEAKQLTPRANERLMDYSWPGNVRELRDIVERAATFSTKALLDAEDLDVPVALESIDPESYAGVRARAEKEYLESKLIAAGWNISKAAREAGKDRSNFKRLLHKHQIRIGPRQL